MDLSLNDLDFDLIARTAKARGLPAWDLLLALLDMGLAPMKTQAAPDRLALLLLASVTRTAQ
jgi:hypothetical protein